MHSSNFESDTREFVGDSAECAAFQATMAERIGEGEDLQANPHLSTCERCSSLVRDLEAIAEAARQLMPIDADPADELWSKIEIRLGMKDSESRENEDSGIAHEKSAAAMDSGLAFEGGVA
jgi:hypothetical protein